MSAQQLLPLLDEHIPSAIAIIDQHDEDDAEYAQNTYKRSLDDQYGLFLETQLVGVSGFTIDQNDIAWISWTYLDQNHQGKGLGSFMLDQIIDKIHMAGGRKIFVATSDYQETPGGPLLYAAAMKLYEKHRFVREVFHPDYYDEGEGQIIYGLRLKTGSSIPDTPSNSPIKLIGNGLITETESSWFIEWQNEESGTGNWSVQNLRAVTDDAFSKGATSTFISIPSNKIDFIIADLVAAGYKLEARLADYYADGIDEMRYRKLKNQQPNQT